jgi:hypothetical protein
MENWYKVAFPASEIASGGKANALQQAFETFFTQHHAPLNAALFTSRDARVTNYFYYFSPGAADIAKPLIESYGGVPTSPPILSDDTILLVGHSDARQNLLQSPPK